jgi:hypothetical protein
MSDSLSIKSNPQLKKRRFRELDRNCWSINDTKSETMLVATATQNVQEEVSIKSKSTSLNKSNKREIKLEKKLISKLCLEIDLAKS